MIRASVTVEDAIILLNEALAADQEAINALYRSKVSCNETLANHPTIQIGVRPDNNYVVGLLGIMNGLFGIDDKGYGAIVAIIDDDTGKITSFKKYNS